MGLDEVRKVVQPELDQDFDALYEEFVEETGQKDVVEFLLHLHDFGLISEALITQLADDSTFAKQRPTPNTGEPVVAAADPASTELAERGEASDPDDDDRTPILEHEHVSAPVPAEPAKPVLPINWDAAGEDDDEDWDEATVLKKVDDLLTMTETAKHGPSATNPSAPVVFRPPHTIQPQENEPEPVTKSRLDAGLGVIDLQEEDASQGGGHKRTSFRRRDGKLEETDAFRRQRRRTRIQPDKPVGPHDSRYVMLGMVGEGAMGTVLLADDRSLRRKVAYKEMSPDIADQPPLASKFLLEAQITAQLDHPNIVPVYDLQGIDAYTMKLIKGETVEQQLNDIRERLKSKRPLEHDQSLDARLEMFIKVCEAMAYAHSRGVVHRDLKPENVMIGEFGEVYVMDWGIAHVMPGDFDEPVQVEGIVDEGDLIIGTAGYMSPEQADARTDELTGASDQYALGLILFELVGLGHAVSGKNAMHIITRHQLGEVDRLVHLTREPIAPELAAIVRKATQEKVADRYPSVTHLADDIRRFLRGDAVTARPDNPWQALVRFSGRHRQATLLAVASVLTASVFFVMLIGVYTWFALSQAAARQQAVSNLTSTVGRQASVVDGQLLRMEGLLLILSTTSEDMLTIGEPMTSTLYMAEDFDSKTNRPPDTEQGKHYQMPVSLQHSAFVLSKSTDPNVKYDTLPRLLPMNRHFNKVLLRSKSEDAAQSNSKLARRTLANVGVPITWAYIALESGAYNVYPGHGGYKDDFDARTTPWYKRGARADGPVWSSPTNDDDGEDGMVVPCSIGLHNAAGELLGVAGIDVDFEYFTKELMPIEPLAGTDVQTYIVDAEGRILIDPTMENPAGRRVFPIEEVVTAITNKRSGGYHEQGDELTVYTRMSSLDWYYVVRGPADEMLAAMR